MRAFVRDPFADIVALQEQVERLFRETRTRQRRGPASDTWQPRVHVSESAEAYYFRFDLCGVTKDEIGLGVEEGALVLRGTKAASGPSEAKIVRQERTWGPFSRTVPLPSDADEGDIGASFTHGVLEVRVGRRKAGGVRAVPIGD